MKDKEGWIKIGDFLKYAVTTDLCKIEFVDRVFHKTDPEEELKNKARQEGTSKKTNKVIIFSIITFLPSGIVRNAIFITKLLCLRSDALQITKLFGLYTSCKDGS